LSTAARRLRELLSGPETVVAPFVYDGMQARLVERSGFSAAYVTGFGTAAARGFPDLGLLTMSEMAANVRALASAVSIPLICDADTGYGNPLNVWRTVREYEDAGAAALHIEDQVFPKKCGFLAGKQVIPLDEMVPKVRAACDARRNHDFVIIARTDALAVNGWDDVVRRCEAYRAAGADLVFVDGIRTREDLESYSARLGHLPLLYNGDLPSLHELTRYRFKVMIHIGTLIAAYVNFRDALRQLRQRGALEARFNPAVFEELTDLMGVPAAESLAKRYRE